MNLLFLILFDIQKLILQFIFLFYFVNSSLINMALAEQVACEAAILMLESPAREKTYVLQKHGHKCKHLCVENAIIKLALLFER